MQKLSTRPKYRKIGLVSEISERGEALVFEIDPLNFIAGFAIKFNGKIYCYRNQCPHTGSQLDWVAGRFFDDEGEMLVCATHGAIFEPSTGKCINGPCVNQRLIHVSVKLEDDYLFAWF